MSSLSQDATPLDLLAVRVGLLEHLAAAGYPLGLDDLERVEAGQHLPNRLPQFLDLVAAFFHLDAAEKFALLQQAGYDIIRDRMGSARLRSVFNL